MNSITRVAVAVQVITPPAHLAPVHQTQILPAILVGSGQVVAVVACTCVAGVWKLALWTLFGAGVLLVALGTGAQRFAQFLLEDICCGGRHD